MKKNCRSKLNLPKKNVRSPNGVPGSVSKSPKRQFWRYQTNFFFFEEKQVDRSAFDDDYRSMICALKGLVEETPITEVTGPSLQKFISVKYLSLFSLVKGS